LEYGKTFRGQKDVDIGSSSPVMVRSQGHGAHDRIGDAGFLKPFCEPAHSFVDLVPALKKHADFLQFLRKAEDF
jgi:hypothetical protein